MKFSLASEQDKIKALAELDGWYFGQSTDDTELCWRSVRHPHIVIPSPKQYNQSYDAIIPLIQKQGMEIAFKVQQIILEDWEENANNWQVKVIPALITATPSQLCDALLIATGRFEV